MTRRRRRVADSGLLAWAPPIVRRIASGVRSAVRRGYGVKRLCLTDSDLAGLKRAAPAQWRRQEIGGIEIRRTRSPRSHVWCTHGAPIWIPQRPPP